MIQYHIYTIVYLPCKVFSPFAIVPVTTFFASSTKFLPLSTMGELLAHPMFSHYNCSFQPLVENWPLVTGNMIAARFPYKIPNNFPLSRRRWLSLGLSNENISCVMNVIINYRDIITRWYVNRYCMINVLVFNRIGQRTLQDVTWMGKCDGI